MKRLFLFFTFGMLLGGLSFSSAQTTAPAAPSPTHSKQIDIGAAEAPLSDSERTDLDKAIRKHDYPAEKAVVDRALAEHPDSFELLVMAGRLAYLEKHPKDAVDAFQRADKIKALSEQDRMTFAIAYEFSGQAAQSRKELEKLARLSPRNAEYLYLLGRIDHQNQHLEQASDDFAKAIRLDPNFVRAYEDLGQAQEALGLKEEARKTYETGAAVNRRLPVPWEWSPLDLGVALMNANQLPEAEKLFQEALRYKPGFAWGHYYQGQLFHKEGRDAEAMNEYKEAVVDDPRLRQAWLALGREFAREGNQAEADRTLAIFKKLEDEQNALKGRAN